MRTKTTIKIMKNSETKDIQSHSRNTVLGEVLLSIQKEFDWIETAFIEDNAIVIEESYDMVSD